MLECNDVSWGIDGNMIVNRISLHADQGEFIGILGPNGSGKSSFLKTIYRINRPLTGRITINNKDIWDLSIRKMAKHIAVLQQEPDLAFALKVRDIVIMGRLPFKKAFESYNIDDFDKVDRALNIVDATNLADRVFSSLSGGEKQRVLLARVLVQEPSLLILDEPTNHLDIYYQIEILRKVKEMGVTTIAALHDLNLAASFCDRIYFLKGGELVAHGLPKDVIMEEQIKEIYNVASSVQELEGRINVIFRGF